MNVQNMLNIQDIVNILANSCYNTVPSPVVFVTVRNMKYRVGYSVLDCKFCSKWLKVDGLLSFLLNFENLHLIIYLLFNSDVIGLTTIMSTQRPTRIETTSTTATPDLEGKKMIVVCCLANSK